MVGKAKTRQLDRIANQRAVTVARAARLGWGGVALSLVMWQLTQYPPPISRDGVLWLTLAIAVYNVPLRFAKRVSPRTVAVMAVASVVGDFLACTGWLALTVNDVTATTYVIYMIVAAEAGLLFRWKGTIAFIAAFVLTFTLFYVFRSVEFHFPYHLENHAFRTGIVCLLALIIGSLSNSSALLVEDVEKLSLTDALTGLGNRRALTSGWPRRSTAPSVTGCLSAWRWWTSTTSRFATTPTVTSPATRSCAAWAAFSATG